MANIGQRPVNPPQPVPNKGIPSYPTPNVTDSIVREVIDAYAESEKGAFAPLDYGTFFNSVQHTSFTVDLPFHQLAYEGPAPGDPSGRMVQRIWVNPRTDQDAYNYSTKFVDEDPEYPIIVRTSVVKRDEWVPKAPLTPDPNNPECLLVSQEMINQTDPPEINSLYVTIVEVYERIPGPIVTTGDFDTELNIMVYTDRQSVLSSDQADPSTNPLILELRETPRSKYTKQRITSYLLELPADRVEYQTGRYPFPALVFGITMNVVELTPDPNRSEVIWYPDMRAAPDVPAKFKITTSFHTSEPANVTVYVLGKRDITYRGISYQFNFSGVLTDNFTTTAEFDGDARYGDLIESYTVAATTPSATEYENDIIGTWQNVGPANIKQWRGQIWVRSQQQVMMV